MCPLLRSSNTRVRVVSLKVDEQLLRRLDVGAQLLGVSRGELVRRALRERLGSGRITVLEVG